MSYNSRTDHAAEILTTKRKPKPKNQGQSTQVEKVLGTTVLPTSRVQKIAKADKELSMLNKEAIFLISIATVGMLADETNMSGELCQALHGGRVHQGETGQAQDCWS